MICKIVKKDKIGFYIRNGKWLLRPAQETTISIGSKVDVHTSPLNNSYIVTDGTANEQWLNCGDFIAYIAVRKEYKACYNVFFKKLYEPIFLGENGVYDKSWNVVFKTVMKSKKKFLEERK